MSLTDLISQVEFVVDAAGNEKAMVDLAVWQELVAVLEQLSASTPPRKQQRLLKTIAASRRAYQSGQVERGTAEELLATLAE